MWVPGGRARKRCVIEVGIVWGAQPTQPPSDRDYKQKRVAQPCGPQTSSNRSLASREFFER